MKKLLVLFLVSIFLLSACGKDQDTNSGQDGKRESEDKEIIKVVEADAAATNNRDVEAALKNFLSEDQTDATREFLVENYKVFDEIELSLTLNKPKVIYKKDDEALVKVLVKYRTPEFNSQSNYQNDVEVINLLKKEEEEWKLAGSYVVSRAYLKEDGTLDTEFEEFIGTDNTRIWDTRLKELKEKDILPSEYFEEIENNYEKEIETLVFQGDQYFNERDLKGWNSQQHPDMGIETQWFMDEREEVGVKRKTTHVETLYANGDQAIVHIKHEFRQDEYDPYNNWNLNNSYLQIFKKHDNEWKVHNSYSLREAWLLEDGTEDPYDTYVYDDGTLFELVETIKNENLDPIETFNQYFNENY